jgi:tRNA A-37 threonylcarbamoyl transferase component Bud32
MTSPPSTAAIKLAKANYDLQLPVHVSLGGDQPEVVCDRLLRLLPGRRVVLGGHWLHEGVETPVVLKLFFRNKEWLQEMDGYQRLCEAMIQVPACLLGWEAESGDWSALIYEYIEGQSLFDVWQQAETDTDRIKAMTAAAQVVAVMHDYGLRQVDIHLDNFLYTDKGVYTLDAGTVSQHGSPLDQKLALENLGDMLAQVPARFDGAGKPEGQVAQVAVVYNQTNPCYSLDVNELQAEVDRMRALRWRHYEGKLTRACTEFITAKNWDSFAVWRRDFDSSALSKVLAQPDAALEAGERLKSGNTATVAKITVDGRPLVIKRYNIKNWQHALGRIWRPSRAWQSWHNAYRLRFEGIHTPLPVAMLEERVGPGRRRAFLITDYVAGPDLLDVVEGSVDNPCDPQLLDQEVVTLFEGLMSASLSHGDMKANNLLVTENGINVIDLDAMRTHRSEKSLAKYLLRDLRRFMKNWSGEKAQRFQPLLVSLKTHLEK